MPKQFLNESTKQALKQAVQSIESQSSAEVVITVRRSSGDYLHAPALVAACVATGSLAFLLFSPYAFSLWSILIDPPLVAAISYYCCLQIPVIGRWLTRSKTLTQHVQKAGRATFFEKGVRHTRDRIGILVYISLVERRIEVIADSGVEKKVPLSAWQNAIEAIQDSMRQENGALVAQRITHLGPILANILPRMEDDENELPDEVCGE